MTFFTPPQLVLEITYLPLILSSFCIFASPYNTILAQEKQIICSIKKTPEKAVGKNPNSVDIFRWFCHHIECKILITFCAYPGQFFTTWHYLLLSKARSVLRSSPTTKDEYKCLIEMQEYSFCSTKPLCNSVPCIVTPPLSKRLQRIHRSESQTYELNLFYLYHISHFASRSNFQFSPNLFCAISPATARHGSAMPRQARSQARRRPPP